MARNFYWVMAVIAAALVQSTWPDAAKVQGVAPDLTLLLVVYFAIVDGEERAMMTGLLGGLYQDVASYQVLGQHVLCLVVVGYAAGRVSTRLITEHPAVKAGLVLLAGLAHGTLYAFIQYVQQPHLGLLGPIAGSAAPTAFYTAVLTPLVFMVLGWIFHRGSSVQGV